MRAGVEVGERIEDDTSLRARGLDCRTPTAPSFGCLRFSPPLVSAPASVVCRIFHPSSHRACWLGDCRDARAADVARYCRQATLPSLSSAALPLLHCTCVRSHSSPSISMSRSRQQLGDSEASREPQRATTRRRRSDSFRQTDAASSASHDDPTHDGGDGPPKRRPGRHRGSAQSASALSTSSTFRSSSVQPRPSFGIQQVLAFLYSYLPRPSPAQLAAAQHTSHMQQPTSHSAPSSSSSSLLPPCVSAAGSPPPSLAVHAVSVYDVSSRSIFNDYVVVLLVSSSRQMSFLSSALYKLARASNAAPLNRAILSLSGRTRDDWQSVDLGSVVVHVFNSRARLTKPGLDFHPEAVLDESRTVAAGGMWSGRSDSEQTEQSLMWRHAVIDNIERQFGDLRVPLDQYDTLRDYAATETGQSGSRGEEATMLVDDTPPAVSAAAPSTADRAARAAEPTSAGLK